ncbi:60S ribosomal protein L10-like protein [Heterocephalus glaber]|uniref:60S ribosomal protein L10-like protein n=1 Tax=Heterocephalus glaber TaxID=10181 RepID=G5BDJ2_HETGA|nr:60S ribosomal protein L10-like protein [Heterocephalus glaber]
MWGAFRKPQSTVARVHIGEVIMSNHIKLQNKLHVIKALQRAKFKFPGHQKIHISKKWGFTKFIAEEYEDIVAKKDFIPCARFGSTYREVLHP